MKKLVLSQKQKTIAKYVTLALQVAIIIAAIIFSVFTIMSTNKKAGELTFTGNTALLPVKTDSMEPAIKVGDLVIAKKIKNIDELKSGDVITFSTVINGKKAINTHRIKEIKTIGDSKVFVTRGDKAPLASEEEVYAKDVLALSNKKIGGIGKAIFWLQTPLNFFLVIMLPLILLLVANGYFFIKMMINLKLKKALAEKEAADAKAEAADTKADAEQKEEGEADSANQE
jgi:signal peptidase